MYVRMAACVCALSQASVQCIKLCKKPPIYVDRGHNTNKHGHVEKKGGKILIISRSDEPLYHKEHEGTKTIFTDRYLVLAGGVWGVRGMVFILSLC